MGIIVSVWLIQKKPAVAVEKINKVDTVAVSNPRNVMVQDDSWKNILTKIDEKTIKTTSVATGDTFNASTLTAQLARDFFSQYLLTTNDGQPLTETQANTISENVLSAPEYTKTSAVVYVRANVKITQNTDVETVRQYHQKLNAYLKTSSEQIKVDPIAVLTLALQNDNENDLKKLDPVILTGKNLIKDLLSMEVPVNVVGAHILLLNTFSGILADVEAMRVSFDDPVKAFSALGQYQKDALNLQIVLNGVETLLNQKSY